MNLAKRSTRTYRKHHINSFEPKDFETYYDYFFYLHLNRNVQIMHTLGMLVGLILFPYALREIFYGRWMTYLMFFFFFYGFGLLSHWIFDGVLSRTAKEAPWYSFVYALKINFLCLLGKMKEKEKAFLKKYPFCLKGYDDSTL